MKQLAFIAGAVNFTCVAFVQPAKAAFIPIPLVTSTYVSSTTLVPITAPACTHTGTSSDPCPSASLVSTMSAGGETLTFSSPDAGNLLIARAAVPAGWASWNSPPFVESSTPRVLQDEVNPTCAVCTLNITLSTPAQTFGVEVEPDSFGVFHTITATFYNGATIVGSIPVTFATGNSSARLLAATTDTQFTNIQLTIDGTDFATAQFRFGPALIPEPNTLCLALAALAVLGLRRFLKL